MQFQNAPQLQLGRIRTSKCLPPRTAVLCMHDVRAINALNVCLRLGRAVPHDIAIMGRANDVALCQCAPVPISSIDINMRGRGYAAIGTSANKYILSVKMREAKRLVENGGLSVKEIAGRTGFSTQSYFSRAYTAYYGRPPSADQSR